MRFGRCYACRRRLPRLGAVKVLITGGAGFIGSTVASACADAGMDVVVLDDLSTGLRAFGERFAFYQGDYGDRELLRTVFAEHPEIEAVVHCAASIVVPESTADPLAYYANNVAKVPGFLAELLSAGCRRLLFSSTASMYQPGPELLVTEESPLEPLSPYAASKSMVERILSDTTVATELRVISLRYFNPIGADPRLRTGLQLARPSHALGRLLAARAEEHPFTVTGTDWQTRDGSGLRDYIHVWDLALAHVAALRRFDRVTDASRYEVINLGSGTGTTVFELVRAFGEVTGEEMPVVVAPPRPGDVIGCCASATKAERLLGWRAQLTLAQGIADSLAWNALLPALLAAATDQPASGPPG